MKKLRNLFAAALLIYAAVALLLPVQANDGVEELLVEGIHDFYTEMEMWQEYFADGALPEQHFRYSLHREVISGELKPYFTFTENSNGYWDYAVGSVPADVLEDVAGRHYTRQDMVVDYLRNLQPDWEFTEWSYADGYYHIKVEPAGYAKEYLSAFAYQGYELLEDGSYVLYCHRVKRYDSTTGEVFAPGSDDVLGEDYMLASFENSHPTWQATVHYGKIQDQALKAVMQVKNGTYAFTSLELIDRNAIPAQLQGTPAQPEIWAKTDGLYASTEVNEETIGMTLRVMDTWEDYSGAVALRGSILATYRFSAEKNWESVELIDTPVELRFAMPEGCTDPAVYYIPGDGTAPHTVLGVLEGEEYVCQVYESGDYVLCQDTNGQTALEELLLEAEKNMNTGAELWGEYFADGQLPVRYFENEFYAAITEGELSQWFTFVYGGSEYYQYVESGVGDIPAEVVEQVMGRHFTDQALVVEHLRNYPVDEWTFRVVDYADGMYHIEIGSRGGMGDPAPIFYYLGYEALEDGSYAVYGWRAEYIDESTWESYVPGPEDVLGEDYVYATQYWCYDGVASYNVYAGKILDESVRMVVTLKNGTYAYTSYELVDRSTIPADLLGARQEAVVGSCASGYSISSSDPAVLEQGIYFSVSSVNDTTSLTAALADRGQVLSALSITAWADQQVPNFQGNMELRLTIPEGCTRPGLFYVSDDGTVVEEIPGEVVGTQYVCTLSHLSTYVLCEKPCPHQGVLVGQQDATCMTDGYTGDLVCSLCGQLLSQGTTVPASEDGHKWVETKVAATCTESGYTDYTCVYCGDSFQRITQPPKGHSIIHHEAQAPTCTEAGWQAYDTCENCDYATAYQALPALGHTDTSICQRCGQALGLWGDANGDGKVSISDAIHVLRKVAGLVKDTDNFDEAMADVDGNGRVGISDAIQILRKIAGLIDKFPAEE